MAEKAVSWLQAASHPADTDRLVLEGLMNPAGAPVSGAGYGVGSGTTELKVQAKGTPDMSVDVLAGHVWIDGTENANQGAMHAYNDATKNLAIAAAHATNPRKDLVVAKVQDAQYSGATNAWSVAVVTGTPAASPAEPAVPANAIVLALVDIAALASSITNANITDRRRRACALGGIVVCTSGTRPTTGLYEGLTIYETDTDRVYVYTGAAWTQIGLTADPPACRVYHNADQSIPYAGFTLVAFNTDREDPGGMHDPVTNNSRITIVVAGRYQVEFCGAYQAGTDYIHLGAQLRLNGATVIDEDARGAITNTASRPRLKLSTSYKFAAADFIEVLVYHANSAAAARNLVFVGNNTPEFSAVWLGRG